MQGEAAGELGDHQEALQLAPGSDPLARRDDLGHGDPERPGPFEVRPFRLAGEWRPLGWTRAASRDRQGSR